MELPENTLNIVHMKIGTKGRSHKTWYIDAWEDIFTFEVCSKIHTFSIHGQNLEISGDYWNVFSKFVSIRELRIPLFVHPDDLPDDLDMNDLDLVNLTRHFPQLERLYLGSSVIRESHDFECLDPKRMKTLPQLACHAFWETSAPFLLVQHIDIVPWLTYGTDLWMSQVKFIKDTFPNLKTIRYIGDWDIDIMVFMNGVPKKVSIVRSQERTMTLQAWKQFTKRVVEAFQSSSSSEVIIQYGDEADATRSIDAQR
jgi:hypothetical protein